MPGNPERPRILRTTPAEDAAIQRGIDADPDNPEWTEDMFARARPAVAVVPELVAEARRRHLSPPPVREPVSPPPDPDTREQSRPPD